MYPSHLRVQRKSPLIRFRVHGSLRLQCITTYPLSGVVMKTLSTLVPLSLALACNSNTDTPFDQTDMGVKHVKSAFSTEHQATYSYATETVLAKPHIKRGYGPLDAIGVVELEVPAGMDALDYAKALMKTGEYAFAEPNVMASFHTDIDDMGDFEELGEAFDLNGAGSAAGSDPCNLSMAHGDIWGLRSPRGCTWPRGNRCSYRFWCFYRRVKTLQ